MPLPTPQAPASSGGLDGFITCGDISCGAAVNFFGESRIFEEQPAPVSFAREP
jgi:hypothetical protein